MSNEKNMTNEYSEKSPIRPALVDTAFNFLLNPAVIDKPYSHKTAFLKKKGLTDAEIALAYERAEKDPKYKAVETNSVPIQSVLPPPVPYRKKPVSFWIRLNRLSSPLIVLGVALFGVHYVYKNYIEPYIFGKDFKRENSKTMEKHILDLSNSISQIDQNIAALELKINSQKTQIDKFLEIEMNEYCPTPLALKELKFEIAAVKSLLLNRHQFPALPKVTPPTIPEWQLPSKDGTINTYQQNTNENEKNVQTPEKQIIAEDSHHNMENCEKNEVIEDSEFKLDQNGVLENVNDSPHLEMIG